MANTKASKNATEKQSKPEATSAGDQEVTVCRRRSDRRDEATADVVSTGDTALTSTEQVASTEKKPPERRKVQRRRQIDPTTCERDYTEDEIEFMHALDAYKRSSGRMFPTCSEILEVVRDLGYRKAEDFIEVEVEVEDDGADFAAEQPETTVASEALSS